MFRQKRGVKHVDKVGKNDLRLNRHTLVKRDLFHIAVYHTMVLPRIKIGISFVLSLERIITEFTIKTGA